MDDAWPAVGSSPDRSVADGSRDDRSARGRYDELACRRATADPPGLGWGARNRTWEWRNQNPLPYRLATPQHQRARGPYRQSVTLATTATRCRAPSSVGSRAGARVRLCYSVFA